MAGIPQGMKDQELRVIRATHRDDPPAERELVGLALSGGGIRSATFGLGVLQALKQVDLLGRIHYLSTVSGGGYIGAWYSANCKRADERREQATRRSPCVRVSRAGGNSAPTGTPRSATCGATRTTCRRTSASSAPTRGRCSRSGCATRSSCSGRW